jgi:Bacteriophage protein gp37
MDKFDAPIQKKKNGEYKIKSGTTVYVCFSTDFLVEDADYWREECFRMIKTRSDLNFLFLTKRIDRFMDVIPDDWLDGYNNVSVGCTVENQKNADYKLKIFSELPIKHKLIICQPLLEKIDITKYLDSIELVVVGGESDYNARELNYEWVLDIRQQCINKNVSFEFRQCGTYFVKDGKRYTLKTNELCKQARLANIDVKRSEG